MGGGGRTGRNGLSSQHADRCRKRMRGRLGPLEHPHSNEVRVAKCSWSTVLGVVEDHQIDTLWGKVGGTDDHMAIQRG